MDLMENLGRESPLGFLGGMMAGLAGRGMVGWLQARAKARPDMVEVGVDALKVAFGQLQTQIEHMAAREEQLEKDIQSLRLDRHRLSNIVQTLQGHVVKLASYAQALREQQDAAGLDPLDPKAFGLDLEAMLKAPDLAGTRPTDASR